MIRDSLPLFFIIGFVILFLTGCTTGTPAIIDGTKVTVTQQSKPTTTLIKSATPTPEPTSISECGLEPVSAPTIPAEVPGYTELDTQTNLHITGTAKIIDLDDYRLEVIGKVQNPLSISYEELRCMPKVEFNGQLECPGFFVDYAQWGGVPFDHLLELAIPVENATEIKLIGADGYELPIDIVVARNDKNFLAYEWEGEPLPVLHGFPVRGVFPGMAGYHWVKWVLQIEVN